MPVAELAKGVVVFKREMVARCFCNTVFELFFFLYGLFLNWNIFLLVIARLVIIPPYSRELGTAVSFDFAS